VPRVCSTLRGRPASGRGRPDVRFLRGGGLPVLALDAQPAAPSPASPATTAPIGETP
jgi:hypothetical protein